MRIWDRFALAAMVALAVVMVGLVMYLCLKNTVADMYVARETGVHTVQQ